MQFITFIGNLSSEPETRTTPSGVTVCSFTVAANRRFANANGERQTDFFRVNAWRQLGEVCARHLSKGKKVAVRGELQARLYDAKNGDKRMSLDVAADEVEFLSPKDAESATVSQGKVKPDDPMQGFTDINTNDLPF
jgi:single-strand DNA-binding protein